jgi:hypothetical protein
MHENNWDELREEFETLHLQNLEKEKNTDEVSFMLARGLLEVLCRYVLEGFSKYATKQHLGLHSHLLQATHR